MKAGLLVLMLSCCVSGIAGAAQSLAYSGDRSAYSNSIVLISSQGGSSSIESGNYPVSPNYQSQSGSFGTRKDTIPYTMQQRMRAEQEKPLATQGWAYAASVGQTAAVYFSLRGGLETDVLKSVSTPWAQKAEIHQTTIDEQGVGRMSIIRNLDVASESIVEFSPQGLHVMLTGLKRELRPLQFFPVTLNFEKAGSVRLLVSVRAMDSRSSMPSMMMDMTTAPASAVDVMRGQPAHMHSDASPTEAPTNSPAGASETDPAALTDTNTAPH